MFPQVSPLWMHVSFGKALDALPDATLPIIKAWDQLWECTSWCPPVAGFVAVE